VPVAIFTQPFYRLVTDRTDGPPPARVSLSMSLRLVAILLSLVIVPTVAGRTRAVASRIDSLQRILVITAHPDDEVLIAPLLANRCIRGRASCSILVMTTGNAAGLGELRAAEMQQSAALLNLRLTQWTFSDVMADVDAVWAAEAGDRATLIARIAEMIAAEDPDLILTLDPRHGSTCHPAHRAIGQLVLETGATNLFFIETAARFIGDGFDLWNASPRYAWVYAANDDWQYAPRVAEIHATQFTSAQVESLRTVPEMHRRVWFAPSTAPVQLTCDLECAPCLPPSPIATSTTR